MSHAATAGPADEQTGTREALDDARFLVVEDLTVRFPTEDGLITAVNGLSYSVELGKTLGIVGESGSGKSVSSMAVLGLHDAKSARITGSVRVGGTEVIGLSEARMRKLRGNSVAMIFQDALAALHPFYKVGGQLAEAYLVHHPSASKRDARRKAIEMLDRVGIPQPDRRVDDFPHQFSGGMRQRAMIAMGLINDPSLLIADEPTTALDVTVQAQILDLLQDLQREFNSAVVIITHDLGVIAEMADDVLVMYAGRAVEYGRCKELLTHPEMPYTWGLLSSVPDVTGDTDARLIPIPGNPPSLLAPPSGCAFHPRCAHVDKVPGGLCQQTLPELTPGTRGAGHLKRCHLANADAVYQSEVLPEIAPDLVEEEDALMSGLSVGPEEHGEKELDRPDEVQGRHADTQAGGELPDEREESPQLSFDEAVSTGHVASRLDPDAPAVLTVDNLKMWFPVKSSGVVRRTIGHVQAVDGISFEVPQGGSLGLVGESGCGKSTTGRLITRLYTPTAGSMMFQDRDLATLSGRQMRPYRRNIQMIFQDPYTSLNPRHTVGSIVGAPLLVHKVVPKKQVLGRVQELLDVVGLNPEHYNRYPNEFSGGQRQRIGIARALTLNPRLLVADEPVSALDVSIQAQVINLLQDLQREFEIAFLFIAHDLAVVRHFCPEVAVMYLGKIVEIADRETIYGHAHHPYTQALLSAVPDVKQAAIGGRRERIMLEGDVPSPINPPSGCRFRTRCGLAQEICAKVEPPLLQIGPRHKVACHFAAELGHAPAAPVTAPLLGVDDQGRSKDGAEATTLTTGPGFEKSWYDLQSRQMVST